MNRKNMKRILWFCGLGVLLLAVGARAQTSPNAGGELEKILASRPILEVSLTRDEAVEIALRESPVVRGASAEVEMAEARLDQARAERKPMIGLYGFLSDGTIPNNIVAPQTVRPPVVRRLAGGGYADLKVTAMFPLYTGNRLQSLTRRAAALRGASLAEAQAQNQEVALLTRLAYNEALARRALVDVWQGRLQEDEEQLRIDRARAEEGKIPPFYVLRDEAAVAETQQEITNAARDVELSLTQLKTVMGVHPLSQIALAQTLDEQSSAEFLTQLAPEKSSAPKTDAVPATAPLPPSTAMFEVPDYLPSLLRLAEQKRPELQASLQRVRAADAGTAAERSAFSPQVNLFATGDLSNERVMGGGNATGVTYGVVAALPIFDGGLRRAQVREAEAASRGQQQERERVALQIGQEVTNGLLNLRAAGQNLQTSQRVLEAAREDYRVARIRYEAGKSIPVEVLDALAARTRAESNVVQAKFQFAAARDQLLRAVGVLPASAQAASD
jgi:outer membrane protein